MLTAPLPARPEYITAGTRRPGALRCAEVSYPSRLAVREHVHDRATITLVAAGALVESQGAARARCCRGTAILRRAGEPHANHMDGEGALFLDLELGDALARSCDLPRLERSIVTHPRLAALAARLRAELRVDDRAQPLIVEALALEIAGCALREGRDGATRRPPPWLARVHERLTATFLDEDVSPARLAAEAGVHPVSLARAFRRHYGASPASFVRARRVAWAAERLAADATTSIAALAAAAGFYDQSHFARAFRSQLGLAPAAYRRAHARRR